MWTVYVQRNGNWSVYQSGIDTATMLTLKVYLISIGETVYTEQSGTNKDIIEVIDGKTQAALDANANAIAYADLNVSAANKQLQSILANYNQISGSNLSLGGTLSDKEIGSKEQIATYVTVMVLIVIIFAGYKKIKR